jgi:hypothetical protein
LSDLPIEVWHSERFFLLVFASFILIGHIPFLNLETHKTDLIVDNVIMGGISLKHAATH